MKKRKKFVTANSNGKINLGRQFAGELFQVEFLDSGQIFLTPGTFRPKHHETFFTAEANEQLAKFMEWMKTREDPE